MYIQNQISGLDDPVKENDLIVTTNPITMIPPPMPTLETEGPRPPL